MFTFHCSDGEFHVQKAEMMKYGEMLSDIAKGGDKLTVDFSENDMKIAFYHAFIMYSDNPLYMPPPCNLYHIFDFFCMEKLTDPSMYYYKQYYAMSMIDALLAFIDDETSPRSWMNNKLYISIINDMRNQIIYDIDVVFYNTPIDKIYDLLVKLKIDTDDIVLRMLEYYVDRGNEPIIGLVLRDRSVLKAIISDEPMSKHFARFIYRRPNIDKTIRNELMRAFKNRDESIRGKVVLLTMTEKICIFDIELPSIKKNTKITITFTDRQYKKCKSFIESLYA